MQEPENLFLNAEEAKAFANACPDPIVREVLWSAYTVLLFRMSGINMDGKFDILFFFNILAQLLDDRERLSRVLAGDFRADDNIHRPW